MTDFSVNIERFTGFADQYDKYRPAPPAILAEILTGLARALRPQLVVDLGSGTGLSTRYWADKAEQVIGVEPTLDMRNQAEGQTEARNISYREGFSHQTNLPDACAHSCRIVIRFTLPFLSLRFLVELVHDWIRCS